jgi:UDP-N-acetylmuramoylalanine--D-glutamate ligase
MEQLTGKSVLVIGWGVTGRALAAFLAPRAARVTVAEQRMDADHAGLPAGAVLRVGREDPAWLEGIDLVVPSPGVPRVNPLLRAASERGVPVIGEIELAAQMGAPVTVAVTGTNGKSTVTTMLAGIFAADGRKTFVGGNLGTPLIAAVGQDYDSSVVEVSSFQLEWTQALRPRVGVYLNLSEDHLDRYRDLAEYGSFKARLFQFQHAEDWAVLNRDDPCVWTLAHRVRARVVSFGLGAPAEGTAAVWPQEGALHYALEGRHGAIPWDRRRLPGRHNLANALAAAAAALAAGIEPDAIAHGLAGFKGLAHRVELVHEKNGVRFVDDSKGTNVGAVLEALEAVAPPIILLAGGVDKGGDYGPLRAPLKARVKALILFGAAREAMDAALSGATRIEVRSNLEQALQCAWSLAERGDTILLSPACSSFDQFSNYAERGRRFKELARAL